MTYDRAVLKFDLKQMRAQHTQLIQAGSAP